MSAVNRNVWIDGRRVSLQPAMLLAQGGEAEVYDLGDGRVVKWWKPAEHPDFVGLSDQQDAARKRIAEAPAKLRALPGNLPAAVVAPCGLALAKKSSGDVVGYLMPKVCGEPLHSYGEPKWRRDHPVPGADVVAALLSLHDAISALHRGGVVVGDCNDLNVLVDGARVHLIDVDSYQLPGHPCVMFSERFVDPRLCDRKPRPVGARSSAEGAAEVDQVSVPVRPHDEASDWFAFAVMAFRSLLGVSPWGGVHQPADPALRVAAGQRALRRLCVYAPDIVYPRAARPLAILPDELADTFRAVFERDVRTFPRVVLERLRLRACTTCGEEHGARACPACRTAAHLPPVVVHGRLRYVAIPAFAPTTYAVTRGTAVHLTHDGLFRPGTFGPERIGSVLGNLTRAWVGPRLGVGFYRAGGYAVGFVFRPDRGVLDDRVALPRLRGQLVDAHAVIGDDRAWLFLTCADAGRLVTTCVVIAADSSVLATATLADASWLAGIHGACAAGPQLFVPTDEGIARIDADLTHTRTFVETAPLVGAGDRLSLDSGGIAAQRARDAIRMHLT